MKERNAIDAGGGADEAARRFVSADSGGSGAELASWLATQPANERALERVELAVVLGRRLAADPKSPLHAEAQRAVPVGRPRARLTRALVWGGALAATVLLAVPVARIAVVPSREPDPIEAARTFAVDAPSDTVAVLPGGVVVDASAVAVLPFAGPGDAALAAGLERDVAQALRTVPGLYVIADAAVQPYAGTELAAAELGGLLGARGLVDATVELVDGRVVVSARLREAATGATLWQTQVDRPVDELRAVRNEIAEHVAATMFDPGARAEVGGADADEPPSSAKPLQQ